MLFADSEKQFLAHLRRSGYSARTIKAYEFDLEKLKAYICISLESASEDDFSIDAVDGDLIRAWVDHCLLEGNSTRTVSRKLASCKSFFNFLENENIIVGNPVVRIPLPKTPKKVPFVLSQDDIRQLLDAPSEEEPDFLRNKAILLLLYSTGIRVSELISLRVMNILLDRNAILVSGKGAKERLLPLSDSARRAILDYFLFREDTFPEGIFPEAPTFITSHNKKMTARMIQYMVKKYGRVAGIMAHVHPHLIRHSIASHLIEEGCNVEAVRQTLGHEDLATTSIYLKTSEGYLAGEHKKFNPSDKLALKRKNNRRKDE